VIKKYNYLGKVLFLLGNELHKIPWLILVFFLSSILDVVGLSLIGPYIALVVDSNALYGNLGAVVDYLGLPTERRSLLLNISFAILFVFLVKTIFVIWINKVIFQFSENQQMRLRSFLMQSYQSLPYVDYIRRNSSEYIYSIQQLTSLYSGQVVLPILKSISDGIVAFFIIVFLAWQNIYVLSLLLVLFGASIFGYDRIFRDNIKSYGEKINTASEKTIKGINEGIAGLKEIRILGKESYFYNEVNKNAKVQAFFGIKMLFFSSIPRYLLELLMISFVVFIVIGTLIVDGNFDNLIPTLGIFGVAALRLLPVANSFSSTLMKIRYSKDAVNKLYDDLKSFSDTTHSDLLPSRKQKNLFQTISLNSISYSYPDSKIKAINDISLEIKSGDSIGIIGASGCGKTTLVDIILGLLQPQNGSLSYNNQNYNKSITEWRSQVAYLPQQIFLIDSSLRQNIALGVANDDVDEEKIHKALAQAKLVDLVNQLPNGVDTLIGEKGVRLSGGQRQRVALARAFYHERSILVMDEATSALDSETEQEVVDEIRHLKGSKTLIVIAHRLTTLKYCDKIYELKMGEIVNIGTYKELLTEN